MSGPQLEASRYYAFDSLRAHMMLLGLLLHASASYTVEPLGDVWPYKDPARSGGFDLLLYGIHVFRMPVFFVMAGFFGALLYARRGSRGFAVDRLRRIAVPFCLGVVLLLPIVGAGFIFANQRLGEVWIPPWSSGLQEIRTGHLWFLHYLLFFYATALLAGWAVARLACQAKRRLHEAFGWLLVRWPRRALVVLPTAAAFFLMPAGVLETSTSLRPPFFVLAAYGIFFGFGWLLYLRRDLMPVLDRGAGRALALSALLLAAYLPLAVGAIGGLPVQPPGRRLLASVLGAAVVWLLVFALLGLYLRYLNRPSRGARYTADASYWVYLVHLPIVIWGAGLLAGWQAPAVYKFVAVLAAAVTGSFLSYHYLVRSTLVGVLLNGRKYPFEPLLVGRGAKPQDAAIRPSLG